MIVSSASSSGASRSTVEPTKAAGTMIHTCLGVRQAGDELLERAGAGGAARLERRDRLLDHVVDDALVTVFDQSPDHVGAHPPEPDHRHLHGRSLPRQDYVRSP